MKKIAYNEKFSPFIISLFIGISIFIIQYTISLIFKINDPNISLIVSGCIIFIFGMIFVYYKLAIWDNNAPLKYFKYHPFYMRKPSKIFFFQLDAIQKANIKVELFGTIFGNLPGIDVPIEIRIQGLIYKYSTKPIGTVNKWNNSKESFWSAEEAYYYAGKVGNEGEQKRLEIRSFKTGLFNNKHWYYIQYNNGYDSGFLLKNLIVAAGYNYNSDVVDGIINEGIEDDFYDGFINKLIYNCNGIIEQISIDKDIYPIYAPSPYIIYFKEKEDALKALELISSRYILFKLLK